MRILNKLYTKNKLKNTIECVFEHLIACSAIKRHFFHRKFLVNNVYPQEVMKKITPWGWGLQSHFHLQPNYSVELVMWLCSVVNGVMTIWGHWMGAQILQRRNIQNSARTGWKWKKSCKRLAKPSLKPPLSCKSGESLLVSDTALILDLA